ncbi:MAG: Helix-turn-helix domain [Actinomycetota bacterium]|jgi:transcriptional regulator with XRE-family HTH domain
MENIDNKFGKQLKNFRVAKDLLQTDFAKVGLSAGYISLIEKGLRSPSKKALANICSLLEITPEDFGDGAKKPLSAKDVALLSQVEIGLDLEQKADYRAMLDDVSEYGKRHIRYAVAQALLDFEYGLNLAAHEATQDILANRLIEIQDSELRRALNIFAISSTSLSLNLPAVTLLLSIWPKDRIQDSEPIKNLTAAILVSQLSILGDYSSARHILASLGDPAKINNPETQRNALWAASNLAYEEGKFEEARDLATAAVATSTKKEVLRSTNLLTQYFQAHIADPKLDDKTLRAITTDLEVELDKVIQDQRNTADLQFLYAEALLRLDRPAEAIVAIESASEDAQHAGDHIVRREALKAWAYNATGKNDQAKDSLKQLLTVIGATARTFDSERFLALAKSLILKLDDVELMKLALATEHAGVPSII